ncbi:DUF389 domain-containing protein [Glaciibacter superstes]|uniref:DUF389 domain-containing protein n=1 Tax=Glaciibacter superstes TaxID=501023 RepID=UPI0004040351|nr:DUF389 domain-containing protein [Glaciibacter superstes]
MLHFRIIVPSDLSAEVLASLQGDRSVTNLIVMTDAAVSPSGDVLLFDVAREGVDPLLDVLREMGVEKRGSIAVEEVNYSFSDAAEKAEKASPGIGDDAVIWEGVEQRSGEETRLSVSYVVLMCVATMIAGVGVLFDQPILIVGAMVVGPDFGPVAALCVGIVRRRPRIVGSALLALVVGFGAGIAATVVSTLVLQWAGVADDSLLTGERPNLDFIWIPDGTSWFVGALAGIAGVLSLTTTKSGGLVGVAISVTTIPAAANAAAAIALDVQYEIVGSLAQLGINFVAILIGGVLTLMVQRLVRRVPAGDSLVPPRR